MKRKLLELEMKFQSENQVIRKGKNKEEEWR
jgi:hypothetical protein